MERSIQETAGARPQWPRCAFLMRMSLDGPRRRVTHCSATFFTRPGQPWVTFVLWLDAPEPRARFARNVDGSRRQGELGAETPTPPNAKVEKDGTLSEL
jgi:hypothetical protein